MPRRNDLESILVIGSGPIVIGQACEFDYSGTQACRVLAEEGFRVVLANSNPATIMTDPAMADRTYVEPLDPDVLAAIIEQERPDALLPTLGGQTALNLTMALAERGVLERYGVEVIGANAEAIATAEDRDRFKAAMQEIGLSRPALGLRPLAATRPWRSPRRSATRSWCARATSSAAPGTGIAEDRATTSSQLAAEGSTPVPIGEILVEQSIAGWKEFELEVMRDGADNCVVVCSIENFDPMGVHTGDSITVAPAQTLTDVEYQAMRDAAFACIRRVGVETGGSNVQFAVDPADGTPGDHRDEPAGVAVLGAGLQGHRVPHRQDRRPTGRRLPARRDHQRHHRGDAGLLRAHHRLRGDQDPALGLREAPRCRPVGSAPACSRWARSWPSAAPSASRCRRRCARSEQGRAGLNADPAEAPLDGVPTDELLERIATATPERVFELEAAAAARRRPSTRSSPRTGIDPWFLSGRWPRSPTPGWPSDLQVTLGVTVDDLDRRDWRRLKRLGFSDAQLAYLLGDRPRPTTSGRTGWRTGCGRPSRPSTPAAAEFEAHTPYHYATTRTRTRSDRRSARG